MMQLNLTTCVNMYTRQDGLQQGIKMELIASLTTNFTLTILNNTKHSKPDIQKQLYIT